MAIRDSGGISRRHLLATGAAVAGASMLPMAPIQAQAPARWRRYNVASPQGQAMMASYREGVRAMLKLPPENPNNWYRAAFTHFLDCPHGNWWILPWHRAFTGYVEQMVRKYSKNPDFAFPYWDWTANPQIPPIMMDPDKENTLNPNADAFIGKSSNFQKEFQKAITAAGYWEPGSATLGQLHNRGLDTPDIMWDQIITSGPAFFNQPNTRNPNPQLDCVAGPAVSMKTLEKAMAPQDFMTFGSGPAANHSARGTSGVLEGQPHNKVHNNTGGIVYSAPPGGACDTKNPFIGQGFMQWNLSPVDPLFFLHHSNLDRLWDAWVRGHGEDRFKIVPPSGPPYYYYESWANEPFLFFYDANGNTVTKNRSGDYISIGDFAYDYQPGSGEPAAGTRSLLRAPARPRVQRFSAEVPEAPAGAKMLAATTPSAVRLRPALVQASRSAAVRAVLAKVTVALPPHSRGQVFTVLVHTGDPARSVEAGTISLFGVHHPHAAHGPAGFTIPIDDALDELQRRGLLKANSLLHFRVVAPAPSGHHAKAMPAAVAVAKDLPVESVVIETH